MKETVLKSLMRLFAIVSQVHSVNEAEITRKIVEAYLKHIVKSARLMHYLIMFDFYHNNLREREVKTGEKQLALLSIKSVIICEQVNQWLDRKHKYLVISYILEVLSLTNHKLSDEIDFIRTIAQALKIDNQLFDDCRSFILGNYNEIKRKKNVLLVNRDKPLKEFRYLYRDLQKGNIIIFYIEEADICLLKFNAEKDNVYLNDEIIENDHTYVIESGAIVKNPIMGTLYFSDIIKVFLHEDSERKIVFSVENMSYNFSGSIPAIELVSFKEEAGQLVGIMGGSGVGKSTFINLLNGNLNPTTGKVLLNGYDVHKEKKEIEGLIGYIPQDDILMNELTVLQNLYFNACLCFKDLSKENILRKVSRLLQVLGIYEIKDLKVGDIHNKTISGGQRKRLNIALELIREPTVLFVDEPTSGLSSSDSDLIIDLLKKQCYKGKLVFLNIHQPSSETFRKLDKLIILDKGGRVVYYGNPLNSIVYLRSFAQLVNAEEGECLTCGNINPDQILTVLEAKKVNESGDSSVERQISPDEWYLNFTKHQNRDFILAGELKLDLPPKQFRPPSKIKQFKIFSIRNLLSRFTDKQYVFLNIIEAPALAIVLSWFTRYNAGTETDSLAYVFSKNINLSAFIFMSVIVSLFLGLMVSAEEIIRDRKIIKREKFLHLNLKSYYNSKVVYVAVLLAVQIFLYVIIGAAILKIKDMVFYYWLMFWLTSLVACMTGLLLSSFMRTVVSIYIGIPLLLVPQIMLGGAFIKFDKLNSEITNPKYVPVIGDLMPSRWALEGVMVHQFSKNSYEKHLFGLNQAISNNSYALNYFIPFLDNLLDEIEINITQNNLPEYEVKRKIDLLFSELQKLQSDLPAYNNLLANVTKKIFQTSTAKKIDIYINTCRDYYIGKLDMLISEKDKKLKILEKEYGGQANLIEFKNSHYNENIADIVLNKSEPIKLEVEQDQTIRKTEPIYQVPQMKFGRSHFYAAEKRIGNYYVQTFWFNAFILLFFAGICYIILIFELLLKIHEHVNKEKFEIIWANGLKQFKALLLMIFK